MQQFHSKIVVQVKNAAQILLEADDDITNDEIDNILGLSGIDDGLRKVSLST
jgi:hypothetical protein